jgi:hypothetical protein
VGELPAVVVVAAAPPVVVVAPLPALVVAALVVVAALADVVVAPLPAEELLVEVAKVVEMLVVEVPEVGLAGQVGSKMTTLTVSNAEQTVFNSPALMAVLSSSGVMLKPRIWLFAMRTEATSGFSPNSAGTRLNKSLTVQRRPPRRGQSRVATILAVIRSESRQTFALMLQRGAPVVVVAGAELVVDVIVVKDEVDEIEDEEAAPPVVVVSAAVVEVAIGEVDEIVDEEPAPPVVVVSAVVEVLVAEVDDVLEELVGGCWTRTIGLSQVSGAT